MSKEFRRSRMYGSRSSCIQLLAVIAGMLLSSFATCGVLLTPHPEYFTSTDCRALFEAQVDGSEIRIEDAWLAGFVPDKGPLYRADVHPRVMFDSTTFEHSSTGDVELGADNTTYHVHLALAMNSVLLGGFTSIGGGHQSRSSNNSSSQSSSNKLECDRLVSNILLAVGAPKGIKLFSTVRGAKRIYHLSSPGFQSSSIWATSRRIHAASFMFQTPLRMAGDMKSLSDQWCQRLMKYMHYRTKPSIYSIKRRDNFKSVKYPTPRTSISVQARTVNRFGQPISISFTFDLNDSQMIEFHESERSNAKPVSRTYFKQAVSSK